MDLEIFRRLYRNTTPGAREQTGVANNYQLGWPEDCSVEEEARADFIHWDLEEIRDNGLRRKSVTRENPEATHPRVLESSPRPRSAVVLNTVQVASLCKQLVKLGLRTALDYGHSECRDSDTSEGLTGRSTRIAVPSSSTALALLLGRLVRPTVERPHPGTNPPLLLANLQPTLRAVGSHSSILISARSLYEPTHILQPKQRILLPKEITSKYRLSDRTALGPAEQLREISDEVSPSSAAFHRKSATS
ncbi:hypothetical protein DAPPUDRAFT_121198 [Daphnia pulex]|uniref:Uncharacterized protein n=1 Tax=Daphnia pulex TaxID=6669 RepID=E9I2V3_DAPPU|nr:hypothetical protein DAPPUDRAFT_121198 [Daphnia pulex]|eukprot:EFX61678.1 hypothetical protein DAPPUDRAFT_121198 [Daphnia pulex]